MATDAILETIKPRRSEDEQLPVTTPGAAGTKAGGGGGIGLRRRMSSFSVHVRPPPSLSLSSSVAAFRRARSMPSVKALAAAGALRRWWEWGLGWVTAPFAPRGLDHLDDEARPLGGGCSCAGGAAGGGWRHVLFKLRAGARRLLGRDGRPLKAAAPQDFGYDSVSYKQNFDDGEA
ncbi:hypothetical protein BDA96_07G222000 [Sorghum bicolor]|jgi:hypothetical protein|uniref:Uncharacterized protein n=2 Tax=Sorghum bicolor TaxID=4558 RepID=A0A921UAJ8_SORBI|nr:uncharacterized protein LOC8064019 [Sorghum bicolor]EES14260.1 hypothetical protein SORBI_3007G209100 [Sorghum bicolor]KAG0524559.1 hypothetical protein BDA96_07G222000 [Sorghum bicolor]|eukprot:XP_021320196.1 uncharacterized protein LOC8064019 [Sorghum bicolor]